MNTVTKSFALLAAAFSVVTAYGQTPKVKVESQPVEFEMTPQLIRGTLMVPVRKLTEAMGGTMRWELEKRTVTIWRGNKRIDIVADSRQAYVNGKVANMDEAAFMVNGRVFAPLKFVAQSAGYTISSESGWLVLRLDKP